MAARYRLHRIDEIHPARRRKWQIVHLYAVCSFRRPYHRYSTWKPRITCFYFCTLVVASFTVTQGSIIYAEQPAKGPDCMRISEASSLLSEMRELLLQNTEEETFAQLIQNLFAEWDLRSHVHKPGWKTCTFQSPKHIYFYQKWTIHNFAYSFHFCFFLSSINSFALIIAISYPVGPHPTIIPLHSGARTDLRKSSLAYILPKCTSSHGVLLVCRRASYKA